MLMPFPHDDRLKVKMIWCIHSIKLGLAAIKPFIMPVRKFWNLLPTFILWEFNELQRDFHLVASSTLPLDTMESSEIASYIDFN